MPTATFVSSSQLSHQFNDNSDVGNWTVCRHEPERQNLEYLDLRGDSSPRAMMSFLTPSSSSMATPTMLINGSNFQSGVERQHHDPQGNAYVRTATFIYTTSR